MEEMHKAKYEGKGVWGSFHALSRHSILPPSILMYSPTQKLPKPHFLGFFWRFQYVEMVD